ncbi:multidrug efflux RND transporter permease subunit VmeK [Vibrio parahaemolyticus]|uniref:multidrug efflux RND transporter permease subunit VmeK n=1 Tax=Vibrio parahaemolyticus TaxID=670 RepID=UPI0010CEF1E1|nr:multidrug efflux RND transporter permease subunit VmeK [Vibrio parahaemolyticus]EGR2701135.1 AcrB/AcrD/AcrF family protein [Vibrio parahaemolyticus]EHK1074619.1 multidrug efflux RND transporter permease subunit VmeK [Vibrio parahaemolyticus]MBE3931474.1 multidrug efflux RND transporter permease subunit VmeK [Vibrio parahaemolyticus]MBE4199427.1 multidrug efflux RND transporter permease subunit VmeK [Vibrio parahaemolyticus]MBE5126853.1 multidrug efflux RND transporter permease subunit VmeK 
MFSIIDAALSRSRTMLTLLVMILIAGVITYVTIPKESSPDITIPIIYVSVGHQGISPTDAERLLVRPIEQELRSIEGVKEMTSVASEGHASVTLEFSVGVDLDKAMADVRDAVDLAKPKLPADSDEPTVNEVTFASEEPVLTVVLYGTVPERTIVQIARTLRDRLESFRQILEVDIAGDREDIVEIVVDPLLMESYGLDQADIYNLIALNNRVVAAGFVDTGYGRFSVKVPSVFDSLKDVLELPIKVNGKEVITFGDVATVRRAFRDPESFARLDGEPAIVLDVKKRAGENIIETVALVKEVIAQGQLRAEWPSNLQVKYTWDQSDDVKLMLSDLQNNILSAIILVVIVIIAILGVRTALLVGISIPGSFLTGLLVLSVFGLTVNIVVLFALIMAVGMLVDGAIVVTEFAARRMQEGTPRKEAYRDAAKRMAWPITASTATTLAAFAPLLFWPDITGEFMKYLPLTLIATLAASLVMALLFVPVIGGIIGKPQVINPKAQQEMVELHNGNFEKATGITKLYYKTLFVAIQHPWKVLLSAVLLAGGVGFTYSKAGLGAEFFPEVDPPFFTVKVRSYGDLSINEKDIVMREIEKVMLGHDEFESVYTRTGSSDNGDEIGQIQITPVDWQYRRKVKTIIEELKATTDQFYGVELEYKFPDAGPPVEHDLVIEVSSRSMSIGELDDAAKLVRLWADSNPALTNLSDTTNKEGIDWQIDIRRDDASRFAADATLVGNTVQFVTNGLKIGDYLPDDADEEVDILVRYPQEKRDIGRFDQLRVKTAAGLVPITNFAQIKPDHKQDTIRRVDGHRVININADMVEGYNLALELPKIAAEMEQLGLPEGVEYKIRGQNEEQENSSAFLQNAFVVALGVMALILITQFNSFYQAFLILSAVLFSTVGVFAGLLIFQKPFGIIMSGIGVIALAGIVVNNNIVLIDTYNQMRKRGLDKAEAILRTGVQRLRPVLLTTITTILGLLPMVLEMNIDLVNQKVEFGAPSTQWWSQLATAVAGGLAFATVLTLVLTPCLLMLGRDHLAKSEPDESEEAA